MFLNVFFSRIRVGQRIEKQRQSKKKNLIRQSAIPLGKAAINKGEGVKNEKKYQTNFYLL